MNYIEINHLPPDMSGVLLLAVRRNSFFNSKLELKMNFGARIFPSCQQNRRGAGAKQYEIAYRNKFENSGFITFFAYSKPALSMSTHTPTQTTHRHVFVKEYHRYQFLWVLCTRLIFYEFAQYWHLHSYKLFW